MSFEMKVIPVIIAEETKYAPCYIIGDKELMMSHQGRLIYFDTPEEAQVYIDDEYELFN